MQDDDRPSPCTADSSAVPDTGALALDGLLPVTARIGGRLARMRRIDELHLEHPFAGARMLSRMLTCHNQPVGRRRVSTLMKQRGITALYRKPHTSQQHPAHTVYLSLLRHLEITRPNHVWAANITYSMPTQRSPPVRG